MEDNLNRLVNVTSTLLVALMLVSGALGGCAVASHHLLRGKPITVYLCAAYGCVGAFFGLTVFLLVRQMAPTADLVSLLSYSAIAGFVGALLLSGLNLSARFILRQLGVEVVVQANRIGDQK